VTAFTTTALELALSSLKRSIDVSLPLLADKSISAAHKETLRAGVIQNFEFCYELCWKTLKRKLQLSSSDIARIDTLSYQDLIREGAQKGWIKNADKWLQYRHERNLTSHTYHVETADRVFKSAVTFYDDALALLQKLKEKIG
jgi:nucleotidyltransferase substrate binding protein (TIGR01987 family)